MPTSGAEELFMTKAQYEAFEALNPFFEVVMEGLRGLVDGDHYFDTIANDAFFEFRYHFPGWPLTIPGRANLIASFSGYGKTILSNGSPYDNRLISVVTIENRKIVHWKDYMDSLAAWTALNSPYRS